MDIEYCPGSLPFWDDWWGHHYHWLTRFDLLTQIIHFTAHSSDNINESNISVDDPCGEKEGYPVGRADLEEDIARAILMLTQYESGQVSFSYISELQLYQWDSVISQGGVRGTLTFTTHLLRRSLPSTANIHPSVRERNCAVILVRSSLKINGEMCY